MAPPAPRSRRLSAFFTRIRKLFSRRQERRIEKAYANTVGPIPAPVPVPPTPRPAGEPVAPAPRDGAPPSPAPVELTPGVVAAPADEQERLIAEQKRIKELREIEAAARKEREQLEKKVAAQEPPTRDLDKFDGPRRGFTYTSWFKAFGTFGDMREMGDSPRLLGEMEELDDYNVPSAFYSSTILGKVRWTGIRTRESLIDELNTKASWNGDDFRMVYPSWEYRYYVAEMVGNVVVKIYEHRARGPFDFQARAAGFKEA